jgi:hypothetical protein
MGVSLLRHRQQLEIRGFTFTHIQKDVFSVIENPFFRIFFCPLSDFKSSRRAMRRTHRQ